MQDSASQYTQLIGTDRPGGPVTAIIAINLNNPYLTFMPVLPDELKYGVIPKGGKGIIEEINTAGCRLKFIINDLEQPGELPAEFWIKRRDFDRFFSK